MDGLFATLPRAAGQGTGLGDGAAWKAETALAGWPSPGFGAIIRRGEQWRLRLS